jgi:hypothetical protein
VNFFARAFQASCQAFFLFYIDARQGSVYAANGRGYVVNVIDEAD